MKGCRAAIGFLTILPVGSSATEEELRGAPGFFPVAGLVEGCLLLGVAMLSMNLLHFGSGATAGLLVAAHVIFTGGLHTDGLSDTFDALALRGSREKKLSIMRDGSAGPVGVTAIVIGVLLRYIFLDAALAKSTPYGVAALLMMPASSRWAMVMAMFHGRPARADGLGHLMISSTTAGQAARASLIIMAAGAAVVYFTFALWLIPALAGVYLLSLGGVSLCGRSFGGLTGDTLGALNEMSEIVFLMGGLACSGFFS